MRSQAEFTVYRLQASVKRESGEVSTVEVLKRYSQFDDLHESVRIPLTFAFVRDLCSRTP